MFNTPTTGNSNDGSVRVNPGRPVESPGLQNRMCGGDPLRSIPVEYVVGVYV